MPNRIQSHIWSAFIRELHLRATNLDDEMERLKTNREPEVEKYWVHRPEGPSSEIWEALDKACLFSDAVRWTAAAQRILKEKDAFVQFFAALPVEGLDTCSHVHECRVFAGTRGCTRTQYSSAGCLP
ncbi:hypothetical protein BDZ89DRAFT_1152686 [Hymenopellis radicata]|nr:hypothetical protein BDZ89DRAFT_1152686 [Hymenopellis radicata]